MASKSTVNETKAMRRIWLGLLLIVLLAVVLVTERAWLKTTLGGPMFYVFGATVAILGMGCANYISLRFQRAEDEVQRASAGFAARWSMPAGQAAFVLLLLLPPFRSFMTSLVIEFGGPGPGITVDRSVVVFAMALGFMGVVMLQAIATMVFNVIWWRSKQ